MAVDTTSNKYRRRWWTLGILTLSLVLVGMDNSILNVAIPTLQREFQASASTLQWMVDAYILVFAGLLLTMGGLGDRFGRAKTLRTGLVIFAAAGLGAAFAETTGQLIAARAIMGVGGALIMPSTLSIITDVFRGPERARAIALWTAAAGIGIGLGPLIGGALLEAFWWGSVFLVNVPIALFALGAGLWLVPDSRDPDPKPIDIPGAVLSTAAVSALVFAIIEAPEQGWTSAVALAGFAAAVVLAAAFALREMRARFPLLNFEFFKRMRFTMGAAAISVAFFALMGMIFGSTQYFQFAKGYSALETGLRLIPVAAGIAIGSRASERLARRFGPKRVISTALFVLSGALAATIIYEPNTSYITIGVIIFFTAVAMGNVMAPATTSVMGSVPPHNAGIGSAMNDVTRQVGGAFGVAVIGSVLYTFYADRMAGAVANLPPHLAELARDSVGSAFAVAASLPPESAENLVAAASSAFADSFGLANLFGSGLAAIGGLLVLRFMPAGQAPAWQPGQEPPEAQRSSSEKEARR